MSKKNRPHRIKCDWCNKIFWSDEPFVVTGNRITLELKCNEQFVKNGYRLQRQDTEEDSG